MLKYEYLACLQIYDQIKELITGTAFITIQNDILYINIDAGKGIKFKYEYKNISYELLGNELNCDKIVRIVMNEYKEFILNRFFRR